MNVDYGSVKTQFNNADMIKYCGSNTAIMNYILERVLLWSIFPWLKDYFYCRFNLKLATALYTYEVNG